MGFFRKKKKENKPTVPTEEIKPIRPACTVQFIKRVDVDYLYDDQGDNEYRSSTTKKYDVLDIVEQYGKYYAVRTQTKQYSRYDRYESPMYYDSEHTTIEFCEISADMMEFTKEQLLETLTKRPTFIDGYDKAPYDEPNKSMVAEEVERILAQKVNK